MAGTGLDGTHMRVGSVDFGCDQPGNSDSHHPKPDWKRRLLLVGLGGRPWGTKVVSMPPLSEANVRDFSTRGH